MGSISCLIAGLKWEESRHIKEGLKEVKTLNYSVSLDISNDGRRASHSAKCRMVHYYTKWRFKDKNLTTNYQLSCYNSRGIPKSQKTTQNLLKFDIYEKINSNLPFNSNVKFVKGSCSCRFLPCFNSKVETSETYFRPIKKKLQ